MSSMAFPCGENPEKTRTCNVAARRLAKAGVFESPLGDGERARRPARTSRSSILGRGWWRGGLMGISGWRMISGFFNFSLSIAVSESSASCWRRAKKIVFSFFFMFVNYLYLYVFMCLIFLNGPFRILLDGFDLIIFDPWPVGISGFNGNFKIQLHISSNEGPL